MSWSCDGCGSYDRDANHSNCFLQEEAESTNEKLDLVIKLLEEIKKNQGKEGEK